MPKTIDINSARGQQMTYVVAQDQTNLTIGLGAGTVIPAGEYKLERRDLMVGDAQVTVNGRPLQAVFAVGESVQLKGTALRALAGNAGVALVVSGDVARLVDSIVVDEIPRWNSDVMNPRTHTMGTYEGEYRSHKVQ